MPQHRRSERLPQRLLDKVKASEANEVLGLVYTVFGGGLKGPRVGLQKPKHHMARRGMPLDIQYSLKDDILTRTEFLRDELASIPVHMAHFDPVTGRRFSTILDCY